MKRFLLTLLALATVSAFAACQGQDTSGSSLPISSGQENSQSESEQESTPEESVGEESSSGTQESETPESSEKEENSGSSSEEGTGSGAVEVPEEDDGYADIEFPRPQ